MKSQYDICVIGDLELRIFLLEMRFPPRLAEAHTNSKVLLKTYNKIGTIQRKLPLSVEKRNARVDGEIVSQEKLMKLLMKVNIQNSVGPVHVVMLPENTVGELIKAAIEIYVKEKRRPLLPSSDSRSYELHYSQFSLESKSLCFSEYLVLFIYSIILRRR